ncbi:MAG TPA: class I SAM-dependent RNA methyltransferase [Polyangiaceae bacterium]
MARALEVEAAIRSLAPGGDGVAHVEHEGERRAVFLPATAPGDIVRATVDLAQRPARGRVKKWLARGPDRVEPACPWSERCGGCDWMHLSLEAQRRAHLEHVLAALPAKWGEVDVRVHPAEHALAYRLRTRVHVRCERGGVTVGMREAGSHDPVEVDTCAVLLPQLEGARRGLAALFVSSRGHGDVQIAAGPGLRPVLEIRWTGEVAPACFGRLEESVTAGAIAGARVWMGDASRPAVVGDPTPWMRGADGEPLRLAPGGFGQASETMNATLAQHVAGLVAPNCADKAVELYAGAGNLSVLLARSLREPILVESSREACDAARANLTARGLVARVVEADAGAYSWPATTRLVVLDPPRTGARAVCERLASSKVTRIVYVSCDTQTLARDLALLDASYGVRSVAAFEMFPQTSHVETVVALERAGRSRT